MKRREFLKSVAVVPASLAAAHWSAETVADAVQTPRISVVLYDQRYTDCRTFADLLAREGAVAFSSGGDAVSVWYGALRRHVAHYGGCVAGMTADSDLAASRACGREVGLKLLYEGSHDCRTSHRLIHRLRGNGIEREVYAALLHDEAPWPFAIADALSRPPLPTRVMNAIAGAPVITTPDSAGHPGYLTSWLLAPSPPADLLSVNS
jgi:hypothetical protein